MSSRKAVVTGASRGIGRAVALSFASAGYEVWALARSVEQLESLARESNGRVRPWRMDAERPDDVLAAANAVLQGEVPYVLVNNAGIAMSAPLVKTSLEDFQRVFAVNVTAAFLLCRELAPAMVARGGGRIINVASTAALKGFKYTSAYAASKHALLGLTRSLALELAGKNVTANAVCPGWTDTDMVSASAANIARTTGRSEAESREILAKMNPMGRLVEPREVAALCLFLASDEAAAITGAAYAIDGGVSAL